MAPKSTERRAPRPLPRLPATTVWICANPCLPTVQIQISLGQSGRPLCKPYGAITMLSSACCCNTGLIQPSYMEYPAGSTLSSSPYGTDTFTWGAFYSTAEATYIYKLAWAGLYYT